MQDLTILERYLRMPLFNVDALPNKHLHHDHFGIVLPIRQAQGELNKLKDLVLLRWSRFKVARNLKKLGYISVSSYIVYPQLKNPVLVYENKTSATHYAEKHVLPIAGLGISGVIKKILSIVAGHHFSTAAIVLVFKVKT